MTNLDDELRRLTDKIDHSSEMRGLYEIARQILIHAMVLQSLDDTLSELGNLLLKHRRE